MRDAKKSRELDVSKPAQAVFLNYLLALEADSSSLDTMPQKQLVAVIREKLLTNPLLPDDCGLTAHTPGSLAINASKAEWLQSAGTANIAISEIAEGYKITNYINNLAILGSIIGQAYINLNDDIASLDVLLRTSGKNGRITKGIKNIKEQALTEIGAQDFEKIAKYALLKVFRNGITDQSLRQTTDKVLSSNAVCRLKGNPETISCGETLLTLTNPGELQIAGIVWAGKSFAGYEGKYRMSSAWSYSQTLDKLQSISKSNRIAKDYATRAEDSLSKGKSIDAVLELRKGVEQAEKSNFTVSPKWKGGN
jgi:hypothetical protein